MTKHRQETINVSATMFLSLPNALAWNTFESCHNLRVTIALWPVHARPVKSSLTVIMCTDTPFCTENMLYCIITEF